MEVMVAVQSGTLLHALRVQRTFQELFPGCARVHKKPGKEPDMIVSFLMKRAWRADCLFLFPMWKRNTLNSNVPFGFRFNSASQHRFSSGNWAED
jgi:hypothetical protein